MAIRHAELKLEERKKELHLCPTKRMDRSGIGREEEREDLQSLEVLSRVVVMDVFPSLMTAISQLMTMLVWVSTSSRGWR
jgi:hypothetical protein